MYQALCPWDFLGNSTGVDCHFPLQGIFPTQGSNLGFPHCRQMLYRLSHQGSLTVQSFVNTTTIMVWVSSTTESLHVLLCSQSPPHPRPLANTDLLSGTTVAPFLELHVNEIIHYVALCVCLLQLSLMLLRSIHAVVCISTSFLYIGE